jgi:hypothetical protein
VSGRATLDVRRPGTLHGLFGFFAAELAPDVSISNSPLGPVINRRAWFLPVERPFAVEAGDSVSVMLHLLPTDEMIMWKVEVTGPMVLQKEDSPIRQ